MASMRGLAKKIGHLAGDTKGATAVEYGLIISLLVIAMLAGLTQMSGGMAELWGGINNKVTDASNVK